jgi:flagellum-specific peptidoglycan hydrolase FlgJ
MKIKFRHIILLLVALSFSCGPKKGIVTKKKDYKNKTETVDTKEETKTSETDTKAAEIKTTKPISSTDNYILQYARIAQSQMRKSKIPASIILAQGILESGSGRGRLAVEANNHFGIKCHGWKGAKIYHDDDRSQECFRKYRKAESSYEDHSEFLTGRGRYAKLFKLKRNDYKGWARGLKAAGYATDRKYPQKLISLIERYKLYKFDEEVLEGKEAEVIVVNRGVIRYIILKGDTLYSLSKRYNTSVEAIRNLNNMSTNDLDLGQELMIPN